MNRKIRVLGLMILFALTNIAFGQTDIEKALSKGQETIQLMDKGEIKESIKLLKEAEKLDPERFDYPYELAYAYYLDQDYRGLNQKARINSFFLTVLVSSSLYADFVSFVLSFG